MQRHRRLRRIHHDPVVRRVAVLLDAGWPTKFAHEGACRTGLRIMFISMGRSWAAADEHAALIITLALHRLGAQRPTWNEGQPEAPEVARETCAVCRGDLDIGQKLYCSPECNSVAQARRQRAQHYEFGEVAKLAFYAARRDGRVATRDCLYCRRPFEIDTKHLRARYCSRECYYAAARVLPTVKLCEQCGTEFRPDKSTSRFCSQRCANAAQVVVRPTRRCAHCGGSYAPRRGQESRRFCSMQCAYKARRQKPAAAAA